MDLEAISKTVLRLIKTRIKGKSKYGNKQWEKADASWYNEIHKSNTPLHENFKEYFKSKKDVNSVLEIGCGTGVYPINNKELFKDKKYLGIDFSQGNIDFCKNNSSFDFVAGDFIKMELKDKYDLVYSHAVIDHVYDIDEFIRKIIFCTKKFAYINSYRGYFPDLEDHKMIWRDDDNCYYNDISVRKVRQVLIDSGLNQNEFVIRKQGNGELNNEKIYETVIEITKTNN